METHVKLTGSVDKAVVVGVEHELSVFPVEPQEPAWPQVHGQFQSEPDLSFHLLSFFLSLCHLPFQPHELFVISDTDLMGGPNYITIHIWLIVNCV